jgi:hypothetical protein
MDVPCLCEWLIDVQKITLTMVTCEFPAMQTIYHSLCQDERDVHVGVVRDRCGWVSSQAGAICPFIKPIQEYVCRGVQLTTPSHTAPLSYWPLITVLLVGRVLKKFKRDMKRFT